MRTRHEQDQTHTDTHPVLWNKTSLKQPDPRTEVLEQPFSRNRSYEFKVTFSSQIEEPPLE